MMYEWSIHDTKLGDLSFPDEEIGVPVLDVLSRSLAFATTGALVSAARRTEVGPCVAVIEGWREVNGRLLDHENDRWLPNADWLADFPASVLELLARGDELTLRGFGRLTGAWTEVRFIGADTSVALTKTPG